MLNNASVRGAVAGIIDPIAKGLLRIGVAPDAVTVVGTVGASSAALWFFPRGEFVVGILIMLLFIFSDLLDGTMARMSGRAGPWGNYLDSTLDRVADGAVFGGILIYFASTAEPSTLTTVGIASSWVVLVGGFTISYAKARAESVGATANVGIAERAERLIVGLAAAFLAGLGVPYILPVAMAVLAVLVVITVFQRFAKVHSQLYRPPGSQGDPDGSGSSEGGSPA